MRLLKTERHVPVFVNRQEEFFRAFVRESGVTLHIRQLSGTNSHHIIEGTFKAVARVLSKGVSIDERFKDEIPSTKGVI